MPSGGQNARPLWDRFHEKFVVDGVTGCWIWTAARCGRDQRGSIGCRTENIDGKKVIYAHRAAWILYNGPVPDGMSVLHRCDVPHCVNPEHLFLGTQLDNMRDCKSKSRNVIPPHRKGEQVYGAKLTPQIVLDIRKKEKMQKEYAAQYGITQQTVSDIWCGRRWNWLVDEAA